MALRVNDRSHSRKESAMNPTSKAPRVLPTLALILNALPVVLSLILIAFSANGNWGFLILGGIVYCVSAVLCSVASLTLAIICLRKRWGRGRAIVAVILSALSLLTILELAGVFLLRGIF